MNFDLCSWKWELITKSWTSWVIWIFRLCQCQVESQFYFPVSSEEVTGKQFPGLSWPRSVTCAQFPAKWAASLHCRGGDQGDQGGPPGHGAMVTSPGHIGSFAVASADLCMGHRRGPEIALQPFNKSCPSLEYINFSLCLSQGGVTCHEKPVKDVFSPLGN